MVPQVVQIARWGKGVTISQRWGAEKTATHALVAAGVLRPGERACASVMDFTCELMERYRTISDVVAQLRLTFGTKEENAEIMDEELTLP